MMFAGSDNKLNYRRFEVAFKLVSEVSADIGVEYTNEI